MVRVMDPLSAVGALGTCLSIALAINTKRNALLAISPDSQSLCDRVSRIHTHLTQIQSSGRATDAGFSAQLRSLEATLQETMAFATKMLTDPPTVFRVIKRWGSSMLGKYTKRIDELSKQLDRHILDMGVALQGQINEWREEEFARSQGNLEQAVMHILQNQVSADDIEHLRTDLAEYKKIIREVYSSPAQSAAIERQFAKLATQSEREGEAGSGSEGGGGGEEEERGRGQGAEGEGEAGSGSEGGGGEEEKRGLGVSLRPQCECGSAQWSGRTALECRTRW